MKLSFHLQSNFIKHFPNYSFFECDVTKIPISFGFCFCFVFRFGNGNLVGSDKRILKKLIFFAPKDKGF